MSNRKNYSVPDYKFSKYDSIYISSTENIDGYMNRLDGKDVLTVAASGDHLFNAYALGAKSVDVFDINYFSKHILSLKKTAINNLREDEYKYFMGIYDLKMVLSYELYESFKEKLDLETRIFWDSKYSQYEYFGLKIYLSDTFFRPYSMIKFTQAVNPYLNNYKFVKSRLGNQYNFYNDDISDLCIEKKYDEIFLSNIQDYKDYNIFIKSVKKLINNLNDGGSIHFAYIYDYVNNPKTFEFDKLLDKPGVHASIIKGMDYIYFGRDIKDKVYTFTKN